MTSRKPRASEARDAERRRRLSEMLDDALPEATQDERPEGWGEHDDDADERLRKEVPPHHDSGDTGG